ncbi:VapE domain-containing protein [Marilutibacter spongiae]|uniref:Virulence factor n=1 Tax=Marilutibacter spongiae TaxID=2025720 RepID=A0A7W3TP43_9GAMM|nr:virulence factor [Lysobacter spongiae]
MARKRLEVIDGGGTPPGGGSPGDSDWRLALTTNRDGRIESTLHNLMLILEHDDHFAGAFWLNESSNQVVLAKDPPWVGGNRDEFTDTDACELAAWLQRPDRYSMLVSDEMALKAVITVARRHRRHPIREYLQGLNWDGTPRVERMFVDLFGVEDRAYNRHAAQCFMVSAVSRILWFDPKQPMVGAKVDFMLVLEGIQGKKKTTAMGVLFNPSWYVETLESPSGKDFYQVILGCWGVEIAEMDSFTKADITAVKGAITRRVDKYRAPYERVPRSYRRECVFVGTTNETEYLRDHTGGRRFLPVRIQDGGQIDLDRLQAVRDQLWAEAVAMFSAGFQWWDLPDDAGDEQEARYFEDSWEGRVARWLDGRDPGEKAYPSRLYGKTPTWTTTDELLLFAIGVDAARHGRPEQMRVANIMKRLGWRHDRGIVPGGRRERRWLQPGLTWAAMAAAETPGKAAGGDDDIPF